MVTDLDLNLLKVFDALLSEGSVTGAAGRLRLSSGGVVDPHVARLLDGKRIQTHLWMFTSRAVKTVADMSGFTRQIEDAGALVMTDTCSAIARAVPKGTKVVALDSAKQTHYLPAMVPVEAWFGTTEDCVHAALTGRWTGELR